VTQGANAYSYVYNGLGDRLSQTVNGATTQYTLDLNAGLTQVLADGTNTYLYGPTRIGEKQSSGFVYHLPDALGSVRQVADATANVTLTRSYAPYGDTLTSTGAGTTAWQFAGEQRDASGLTFLRTRYLSTATGRFITQDEWPGTVQMPATLHPYLYGLDNPVLYTDPSGRCFDPLTLIVCAAVGGAAAGAVIGAAHSIYSQAVAGQPIDLNKVRDEAAVSAVIGGVGGLAYGVTLGAGALLGAAVGISSSSGILASAWGAGTAFAAGGVSGQATRALTNLNYGKSWNYGQECPEDVIRNFGVDGITSVILYKVGGMVLNRIGAKFGLRLNAGNFRQILFPQSAVNRIRGTRATVDNVLDDPQLLLGKTPEQVSKMIQESEGKGWKVGPLGRGTLKGQQGAGLRLLQMNEEGNPTGKMITFNPLGKHHGGQPYWKVSSPEGGISRVGRYFFDEFSDYHRWSFKFPVPILHIDQQPSEWEHTMANEEWRLKRLIESLQLLAADHDVQLSSLPDFVNATSEIVSTFDECLLIIVPLIKGEVINDEQAAKIREIDQELGRMDEDKELWTDLALQNDPRWEEVRSRAKELLFLFGEKQSRPNLYWATYVKGGRS